MTRPASPGPPPPPPRPRPVDLGRLLDVDPLDPGPPEVPQGCDGQRNGSTNGQVVAGRLVHRPASEVKVKAPIWHERGWLVAGALQLLIGRQSMGKSIFAAWLTARASTGRAWTDKTARRRPLRCAMLSLEEPDDRLVARLTAAGADLRRVEILGQVADSDDEGHVFYRPWRLPADCAALEATITDIGAKLVTVDGLGYSITGDSHNYAIVGGALSALAGVAERTGCTIVGITHPPKGASDAVTAAIGSTAWTALARITWVLGADPADETGSRRVVAVAKSNYRLPEAGLSFRIGNHGDTEAGYVVDPAPAAVDPQSITAPPEPDTPEQRSRLDEARAFLRDTMEGRQWVSAAEAKAAAVAGGISEPTLDRARRAEGIVARNRGKVGAPDWVWEPPAAPSHHPVPSEDLDEMGDTCSDLPVCGADSDVPLPSRHDETGEEDGPLGRLLDAFPDAEAVDPGKPFEADQ